MEVRRPRERRAAPQTLDGQRRTPCWARNIAGTARRGRHRRSAPGRRGRPGCSRTSLLTPASHRPPDPTKCPSTDASVHDASHLVAPRPGVEEATYTPTARATRSEETVWLTCTPTRQPTCERSCSLAAPPASARWEAGRAAREALPLEVHAEIGENAGRDPIGTLRTQDQDRVQQLVPIRWGRMSVSPFTFYRGAAAVMASDLGGVPHTNLRVQLCGDAHLSNFGAFAAPDRRARLRHQRLRRDPHRARRGTSDRTHRRPHRRLAGAARGGRRRCERQVPEVARRSSARKPRAAQPSSWRPSAAARRRRTVSAPRPSSPRSWTAGGDQGAATARRAVQRCGPRERDRPARQVLRRLRRLPAGQPAGAALRTLSDSR